MRQRALDRQTLADLQLICSGSMEGVMEMCSLNDMPLTAELQDGDEVETGPVVSDNVVERYAARGHSPATSPEPGSGQAPGGIGYMRVEVDFIVS